MPNKDPLKYSIKICIGERSRNRRPASRIRKYRNRDNSKLITRAILTNNKVVCVNQILVVALVLHSNRVNTK